MANPDFYVKLVAIAAAIVCLRRMKHYAFSDAATWTASDRGRGKAWAGAMLVCWAVAILAGRLTAYTDSVRRQSAVAVVVAVVVLLAARAVVLRVKHAFGVGATTRVSTSTNY